jgi:hypothetical protein
MFIRPVEGPLPFNIPTPEDKAFKKPTPPSNKPTNNATPLNIDALISAQLQNIAAKPSDATPKTFGETPPTKTYGETSAPRKPSDKTPSSTFGETPSKPSSETFGRLDFTRTKDGVSSTADVSSRASPVSSGVPPVAPRQVTLSSAPYATDPPKYLASQTRETDAGASQRPANLSSPFKTSAAASPAQTSGTYTCKGCPNKNARFDCLIKHGSPWKKIKFLDDLRCKHSEILYGTIIRQKNSSILMVHSFPFDKIFDDKFEEIRLYLIDATFNFTFQYFKACGFVGVNL